MKNLTPELIAKAKTAKSEEELLELAKASGVSVRSIQLFEQRKSNINNAQYNHLSAIAKVLGCEVQDLLE